MEAQALSAEAHKSLDTQVLRVAELEYLRSGTVAPDQTPSGTSAIRWRVHWRNATPPARESGAALADERGRRERLAAQLQEVYNSRAWRVTAPFRAAKDGAIRVARRLLRVLMRHKRIRRLGGRFLAGQPGLKSRLRRLGGLEWAGTVSAYARNPSQASVLPKPIRTCAGHLFGPAGLYDDDGCL